jgi:hypothetical protein
MKCNAKERAQDRAANDASYAQSVCQTITPFFILFKQLVYLLDLVVPLLFSFAEEADEETSLSHVSPAIENGETPLNPEKGRALPRNRSTPVSNSGS